jgi:hypothetical protein
MRTQLWLSLAVTLAVGCKTDPPASSNGAASNNEAPTAKGRSAKIDVKPVAPPSLPADDSKPDKPDDDDRRARRQARLDSDGDGKVSDEERAAATKQRMTRMHDRLDSNGDGKLTPEELANAPGRFHFDDPASIDANHDGEVTVDELQAAIKARRDARRAARGAGTNGAPAPGEQPEQ